MKTRNLMVTAGSAILLALGMTASSWAVTNSLPAPTPLAPQGLITTQPIVFSWTAVSNPPAPTLTGSSGGGVITNIGPGSNAVSYVLNIFRGTALYAARMEMGTTWKAFWTFPSGEYTWKVMARSRTGTSPWSAPMKFSVKGNEPGSTQPIAPAGVVPVLRPEFSWSPATNASGYNLLITRGSTAASAVYRKITVERATRWAPNWDFPAGAYSWRVIAVNRDGFGPWSDALAFEIKPALPTNQLPAPAVLAPTGTVANARPEFKWTGVDGANGYRLMLQMGARPFRCLWIRGATAWTPMIDLPVTNYAWKVQAWNGAGPGGLWSEPAFFTIIPGGTVVDVPFPAE